LSDSIYWFTNDLRLSDNLALSQALAEEGDLSFIYCLSPKSFKKTRYSTSSLGQQRYRFILESLKSLDETLQQHGQYLNVYYQEPVSLFGELLKEYPYQKIYLSAPVGFDESQLLELLRASFPHVQFISLENHTLYHKQSLPFSINDLPETFTQFRKSIEKNLPQIPSPISMPSHFKRPLVSQTPWAETVPKCEIISSSFFQGGQSSGFSHLKDYFSHAYPQTYKETRNELEGMSFSTKCSPWLAQGCISARQVHFQLKAHELEYGSNESTYWIFFELLWREYFQWYALKHGSRLFHFGGIENRKPLTSFYADRYQRWCQASTQFPIVNACMKQLNETGYMSNRGRQLVASCFVNELGLDWRYGAAYFEQQLIDYDVASNWGNWQYLAGVGADPRGLRAFNLEKQTQQYDPEGKFVRQWKGHETSTPDALDMVGWPVIPTEGEVGG